MTRLIMVRHGETEWNAKMRFQGQSDIELTPRGREQARGAGDFLARERIDVAYSSDLLRCSETAAIILEGRRVDLKLRPELREINFGDWEGLTFEEINGLSPGILDKMRLDLETFSAPGGETWAEVSARVGAFLDEVLARHPDDSVLIVAHVNPLRLLVTRFLQIETRAQFKIQLYNCSVSIFESNSGVHRIVLLNEACHLGDKWP